MLRRSHTTKYPAPRFRLAAPGLPMPSAAPGLGRRVAAQGPEGPLVSWVRDAAGLTVFVATGQGGDSDDFLEVKRGEAISGFAELISQKGHPLTLSWRKVIPLASWLWWPK